MVVTSRPPRAALARPRRPPRPPRPCRRRRWLRLYARLLAAVVILLLVLGAVGVVYLVTLPDVGDAEARVAGVLHPTRGSDTGLPVPARVGRAVIAIEDERFYHHHGIDVVGVARAAHVDLAHGSPLQGGSTITQQLAKALYVTDNHTLGAKLRLIGLTRLRLRPTRYIRRKNLTQSQQVRVFKTSNEAPPQTDEIYTTQKLDSIATSSRVQDI